MIGGLLLSGFLLGALTIHSRLVERIGAVDELVSDSLDLRARLDFQTELMECCNCMHRGLRVGMLLQDHYNTDYRKMRLCTQP